MKSRLTDLMFLGIVIGPILFSLVLKTTRMLCRDHAEAS
jgi:hypothetical protein